MSCRPLRFRITTRTGTVAEGVVRGFGGVLSARNQQDVEHQIRRMRTATRHAAAGRPLRVYEPEPGCCLVYTDSANWGSGEPLVVPMAGATVDVVEASEASL